MALANLANSMSLYNAYLDVNALPVPTAMVWTVVLKALMRRKESCEKIGTQEKTIVHWLTAPL